MPNDWPNSIPPDLRRRLENVLTLRNHGAPELWSEVRAWLIEKEVPAPGLPPEVRPVRERQWPA